MKRWFLWSFLVLVIGGILVSFMLRQAQHERRPTSPVTLSLSKRDRAAAPTADRELPRQAQKKPMAPGFIGMDFVDQSGRPFDEALLHGRPWIADFIFTSCAGSCPIMSDKMASLQKQLPPEVLLVSFSVDPKRDTPEALAAYARRFGAQPGRWSLLTATTDSLKTDPALIYRFVQHGFNLSAAEGGDPEEPIIHSSRFVLVDRTGEIRGYYDSSEPEKLEQLAQDAAAL